MARVIGRRFLLAVPTFFLATIILFILMRVMPGDAAYIKAGGLESTPELVQKVRESLSLDDPVPVQYVDWLGDLARGDLGISLVAGESVWTLIKQRAPVTISLTIGAIGVAVLIALPLGIVSALRSGGIIDKVVSFLAALTIATPSFFLGLILVLVFALKNPWLPATGYVSFFESPFEWARHIVLPSIALGLLLAAELTRHLRGSLRDVLRRDYVRTAYSGGVPTRMIVVKHALPNAAIPVVTVLGLQLVALVGGTVIIEQVFGLPGLGNLMIKAVFDRDYPIIQSITVLTLLLAIIVSLVVDLTYSWLNPKVRFE